MPRQARIAGRANGQVNQNTAHECAIGDYLSPPSELDHDDNNIGLGRWLLPGAVLGCIAWFLILRAVWNWFA
jgi:hypothetical protein